MTRGALRVVSELVIAAVEETIEALTLQPEDKAAVQLARKYATAIDEADPEDRAEVLEKLGPKMLTALESLGATPAARAKLKGGAPTRAQNRLEAIRSARR